MHSFLKVDTAHIICGTALDRGGGGGGDMVHTFLVRGFGRTFLLSFPPIQIGLLGESYIYITAGRVLDRMVQQ
jgi:hypothetical protein